LKLNMSTFELYTYNTTTLTGKVFSLVPMEQLSTRFLKVYMSPTEMVTYVFDFKGSVLIM
jgi:hypothetical protein